MDAIVMAAGEGRRLRPLTEQWAKPVLPIDGRPVLATLLRALAGASVERVVLVSGHHGDQVVRLAGDGSGFGVPVRHVRQQPPSGSADAVRRALAAGARLPALVAGADTVFAPGDVGRFLRASAGADGAVAVRLDRRGRGGRVRVEDGVVRRIPDDDPSTPLSGAPLWLLGPAVATFLADLPGPPYELAEAYARAIAAGIEVRACEIGETRDLTRAEDLAEENFPYLRAL